MNLNRTSSKRNKEKEYELSLWGILEAELFRIMEKSLKAAMDKALDDIFKDWK